MYFVCVSCDWEGTDDELCQGRYDVYCPECLSKVEEVSPEERGLEEWEV